jgi:hypothetical protein
MQTASQAAGGKEDDCGDKCDDKDRCGDKCHSDLPAVQAIGQLAVSEQDADSHATSKQTGASNVAGSVDPLGFLKDHGKKDDGSDYGKDDGKDERGPELKKAPGSVSQTNASAASSQAGNTNGTSQDARQLQGGFGGVQAIGQAAFNDQDADSEATSKQWFPSNVAFGDFGAANQANTSAATSAAGNTNGTAQRATQAFGPLKPVVI